MKKSYILFTLFLFAFITVNSQILNLNRAKESAEDKTEQRVDNKVDEGIDKSLDKVEDFLFGKKKKKSKDNSESEKSVSEVEEPETTESTYNSTSSNESSYGESGQEPDIMKLFGSGTVEVKESFEFTSSIDIKVTTTDKKENVTVMTMKMLFPENEEYFGMEINSPDNTEEQMPPMKMVYDFESQQMVTMMINSGQKIGMVISINEEELAKWVDEDDSDIEDMPEWKKTGKTKNILGYTCEQYVFSDNDGSGEAWVSDDDDLNIGYAMNAMANSQDGKNNKGKSDYPDGAILEMTFTSDDGETMSWIATEIKTDTHIVIKTEGYQFMNLGGGK